MVLFPSKEWMSAFREKANTDEEYRKIAEKWEGAFLCKVGIDDVALKELADERHMEALIGMLLPSAMEKADKWAGTPMGNLLERLTSI